MSVHLIIGASGQVGAHLVCAVADAGFESIGTCLSYLVPGMPRLDIRSKGEIESLITNVRPAVVYLPASLANVDYCEQYPEEGYAINVIGVCNVVQYINRVGAKLIYFSSDYIFDGKSGPYHEDDTANPICEYGRQKLIAEHYIALHACDYLIVRTTVLYGWERQKKNFVYRLLNTLQAGRVLKVPVDQIGNPTYTPDLAQAVVRLVLSGAKGVYHVVGPELVNRYEFACEAARVLGLEGSLIQAVASAELKQLAPRPLNAGMVAEKAANKLKVPLLGYREGLRAMASVRMDHR